MTAIVLVVLFISQLLTFYFLIILNSKISKYKEIERKQEAIIREMDDAISAYLVEVKDENDRFIQELKRQSTKNNAGQNAQQFSKHQALRNEQTVADAIKTPENQVLEKEANLDENSSVLSVDVPKVVPKSFATTAYKKQMPQVQQPVQQMEPIELEIEQSNNHIHILAPFEQEVVDYYKSGWSIEEIAKKTQKGKKEIELLIKFHA